MNQPESRNPPDDRLTRFSDRTDAYAKHRPSYPSGAIDAVLAGLVAPSRLRVLDIGAGTGISSRLLAERGCHVVGVEPNDAMRAAASPHPLVEFIPGTGEQTGRADGEFNVVTCFQAFHWLRHEEALAEFARILKPGGRAALVWNVRDDADPFTRSYGEVILKHATDPPTSPYLGGGGHVPESFRRCWLNYELLTIPNEQSLDLTGLIGRALSASYCPNTGPARAALESDLEDLFRRFAHEEQVRILYRCEVHRAVPPPAATR